MYKNAKPLFFICETPLHAGSGSDLGIVDLPIQRERHTSFPKIESSSFKGAIRQAFESVEGVNSLTTNALFGTEDAGNDAHAGALAFTDARLLLFPVKSVRGVFAWVTCPKVLEQFKRDMSLTRITVDFSIKEPNSNNCLALNNTTLKLGSNKIVLEEYAFTTGGSYDVKVDDKALGVWLSELITDGFWKDKLKNDIVILANDDFKDFVNLSTEVITRIKIDNKTGTVEAGALFTEEFLPAESIMYSLVMASPVFLKEEKKKESIPQTDVDVMNYFATALPNVIQIGGDATLGKGIVRVVKSLLTAKEV
ncbi:type III-B CRISPR module RAMP protein Cmr4 [Runella sp. MFBS21]|uniref:type III-B CRISPR module RAMP protein Cmr4 n=1 Tax=Runella sp. MFBS21 TaxID=3034018 RepID=UPI0023F970A8|nr:type III-B CRISPR module RAMP protein Cmr4 [Runella sp. MFBS21]MDF7818112.1 type III-B CRISPR module RAMP protein Cmr4 [Runella sp. MFBS21]